LSCAIISFMYKILVIGGNFLVGVSAMMMDFFLQHSIQSSTYKDQSFIGQGWEIVRDLTNIVFIFALIVIAFNLVLGSGGSGNKFRLIKVILISLTINFSLFGAYMLIDTSNILAHVFYNKIGSSSVEYKGTSTDKTGANITSNSVSLGIASQINPQKLLGSNEDASNSQRTILILIIGAINITLIYTFLSVSFLFLGRTIGLWISAILAPLALASITVPGMDKLDYIGFGRWLSSFLKMAFMAPVFLFFLYLAVEFMKIKPTFDNTDGEFLKTIMQVLVPLAAVVVLILASKKVANKMSGDFAGTISSVVTKGVTGAAAVGLGAGAMALSGGMAGLGGITKVAGMGAEKVGLKKFGKGAQSFGSRMGRTKTINVTKIPGFGKLTSMGGVGGAASYFNKNIAGQSGKSLRRKAELGIRKATDGSGDGFFGRERGYAESDYKHKKEVENIKDGAQNWQSKLENKKAHDELKKAEGVGKSAQKDKEAEYQEKIHKAKNEEFKANEKLHQKEGADHKEDTKTLLGIEGQLKKLNTKRKDEGDKLKAMQQKDLGTRPVGVHSRAAQDKWDIEKAKITKQKQILKQVDTDITNKKQEKKTILGKIEDRKEKYGVNDAIKKKEKLQKEMGPDVEKAYKDARRKYAADLSKGKESGSWEMATAREIVKGKKSKSQEEKIMASILDKMKEEKSE
ncbi:MAG: hypothetical protein LR005_00445, partial [Candidatus Pacebacteria bacterium]|nr:hypothetical protein [Candidatus Paceibacterota bacterium]